MKNLDSYTDQLFSIETNQDQINKKMEYSKLYTEYLGHYERDLLDDNTDIVPEEFQVAESIDQKISILQDALDRNVSLEDSPLFDSIQEGTHHYR